MTKLELIEAQERVIRELVQLNGELIREVCVLQGDIDAELLERSRRVCEEAKQYS